MKARDLSVLLGVILIIIMLIIPLPGWLLSVLILCNISIALIVILVSMNTQEALQFSVFPTLLLLLTLFRLGLNVSTTRSILSEAQAGGVVETFGSFVIGGNPLVGFVVFIILVIIQFLVITKGAERVSEVSARFTLDAMPGKQMSIDADLNAGLISEQQAKERREKVENEADFHGSMDGASKFVKGDAIAGIIIVLINIIFGLIIGMVQMDMTFQEAINTFMRLTVGDGLVSQIPALLISTATGIVVTRTASTGNLGTEVSGQLLQYPKLLYIAAGTIFLLGLTPINFFLTTLLGGLLALSGYLLQRQTAEPDIPDPEEEDLTESSSMKSSENVVSLLNMDPIEFEFGYALIPLADSSQGGDLLDRIIMIRRQLAIELGIVIPVVRIRDNIQLNPNEYRLKIKGNEVAKGELLLDHYLAMAPDIEEDDMEGIATEEPAFGLPAKWITEEYKDEAELSGYTVVDPPSVVSTHITEIIKKYAYILLGREETKQLIEHLRESYPTLAEEVTPEPLNVGDVQKVLSKLLKENISIRNLPVIFESLADFARLTNDTELLAEYVRQALSPQITKQYVHEDMSLRVITVSGKIEKMVAENIQQTEHGNYLSLDPETQQEIIKTIHHEVEKLAIQEETAILLCSPAIRMYLKQLVERFLPQVVVLSYNELEPTVEVQSVGVVNIA
ncbi:flagellar biosynthesis protein FlhA [Virgibacillus halodenitrificans]|uniref:Flagellar biosynthesis protein FlhA n=1 Tax=Virgibacillus halodenitrificans TaxID=1482 RepID=A0AAC9J0G3_VIRHA|nr:flagellar biosynthesis protein FlhA [Virgibacillus halodenitrificans]APC48615.1 flagellar biosynthesis protein FlhA [Virgibacillus halodenitrificans]MBD1224182.1 flagellar biosynthesis protein FlhA [Virgibacillus halodenitrificans]MCG1028717.1 flagellar biosynthesis protein FlhA [Virgibacillus halodenitrificans]MCJ0931189.1 flagellar biosynthesis protein FlhA [Virgibacillus halodenitrificans]MEC2160316.1 flagellar biosynthesis protein FlhA [Virgibacillus halodenitrificans]